MLGTLLAGLGGVAFFAIGLGALLAPGPSSVQYGLPTRDRTALALVRAIGARDLILGIIVLILLASRERDNVAMVLAVSIVAALTDAGAVASARPGGAGPRQLAVHVGGAAALFTAWAVLRSER